MQMHRPGTTSGTDLMATHPLFIYIETLLHQGDTWGAEETNTAVAAFASLHMEEPMGDVLDKALIHLRAILIAEEVRRPDVTNLNRIDALNAAIAKHNTDQEEKNS